LLNTQPVKKSTARESRIEWDRKFV